MKLKPIENSLHFELEEKNYGDLSDDVYIILINTDTQRDLIPLQLNAAKGESLDTVQFFDTGCYVKLDQNYKSDGKKCYTHFFYNNHGDLIVALDDADMYYDSGNLCIQCQGHFEIQVESNGLKIIHSDVNSDYVKRKSYSYNQLKSFKILDKQRYFEKTYHAPQKA